MSQWTTQESQSQMYRPTYLGKRGTPGGGGPTSSAKRGSTGSYATSKRFIGPIRPQDWQTGKYQKKSVKATFAKLVREVAEKKTTNNDPIGYTFNANNTTCSPAVDLIATTLDAIAHGSQNGQRIGNDIYVHKFDLKLSFSFLPGAIATVRPGYVQVWVATLKDSPSTLPNATDLGRIYDDGGGSSGPDGTMLATLRNLNKDYFNFKAYKMFKLGPSGTLYANNDFPINVQMTIPGLIKGRVRYNDTTAVCNKYCFMFMAFTSADNTPVLATIPVDCQYYVSVSYSDV